MEKYKKMKLGKKTIFLGCIVLSLALFAACGGGGGSSDPNSDGGFSSGGGSVERRVIENFVNNVVLDIYGRLDVEADGLMNAVDTFVADPTDANLELARAAWIRTRIPWEESETALFGPVDFRGFDPALDSWPVNRVDLEGVLMSGTDLSVSNVATFDHSVKGYHTIEFLLFGIGGSQTAAGFDARRFEYLSSTTTELRNVAGLLLASWTTGLDGSGPYAEEFISAGQGSLTYPSERSALEEIARAMSTIADEVANGKIADPFDTRDTELVESQFSFNSITDFTSNIRGIQISYERSLSEFVASVNPELDARTKAQINASITALGQIPEPFRDAILDPANDAVIVAAQNEIRELQRILDEEIIPLLLG